eukprot:m.276076 g.276076  ORF g.276076 m.276076 type:complete len:150 (-) comp17693_c2_seq2:756-1205(-)
MAARRRKETAVPEDQTSTGTFVFPDGSSYEGEFLTTGADGNIQRSGKGTMSFADGSTYVGEWKDDMMHGDGCMQNADGSSYKGTFSNGLYEGFGCYTFADGAVLETVWCKNQPKADVDTKLQDAEKRVWLGCFKEDSPLQALLKPELAQ